MRAGRLTDMTLAFAACALVCACGASARTPSTPTIAAGAVPSAGAAASTTLLEWPEFGLNPQRSSTSNLSSGIDAADLAHLSRITVHLPGTVDSAPIYLHDVTVQGQARDVIVVNTTYGKTIAIDASSGRILWVFTPPGYSSWAGSAQITTSTPLADPDHLYVYSASPDGVINKLALSDGTQDRSGSWPVRITRDGTHEKITAGLNIDRGDLIATTGGYIGDIPPYQGHVVLIDRSSGRLLQVFNTLCSGRRYLQVPSTCPASDSAILSRAGAVVEPGGSRLLISTGNASWNGSSDFGDSVLELTLPGLRLRQEFTPTNQEELNRTDTDLGSSAPALIGDGRVLIAGKDGILRVLLLSRLDGHAPSGKHSLGGEIQRLSVPGGAQLFSAPAVWSRGGRTTVFIADAAGTGAYVLRGGVVYRAWENGTPGTSPVLVGGLLYVYNLSAGGIEVYRPGSPAPIAHLPGSPGHWNSPIVVDGHVIEPEGNANEHLLSGTLDIFTAPRP